MAKINSVTAYDGAEKKIERLGLQPLVEEVKSLVKSTSIALAEQAEANSAAVIR